MRFGLTLIFLRVHLLSAQCTPNAVLLAVFVVRCQEVDHRQSEDPTPLHRAGDRLELRMDQRRIYQFLSGMQIATTRLQLSGRRKFTRDH
jgi:hypothetical protein